MSYHPRIECKDIASFQTTRTCNSELWFINNPALEAAILGYTARYTTRYGVNLYALAIEGNHIQAPALYPQANRAHFKRDLNSSVARAVKRYQPRFRGGRLWQRRYSAEYLAGPEEIEAYFFYTVLQPVQDGLVDDIRDYPGYNCFEDAITGTIRHYKVVRWKEYNDARRRNREVSIEEFTELCPLKYARLPGYEGYTQEEYARVMRAKLAQRTAAVIAERRGKPSLGAKALLSMKPGAIPKNTKTSGRNDHRPRVLATCPKRYEVANAWYFGCYHKYKAASKEYRAGNLNVLFPPGTYKPPLFTVAYAGAMG